jgi:hypothetical protein
VELLWRAKRVVTTSNGSHVLTALAIGVALAGAPGPVQAVLLAEAVKGGVRRGLRALAGVHATFGMLLLGLALGISVVAPKGMVLRILMLAGGALLLWLAFDGLRSRDEEGEAPRGARALSPEIRGSLSILLNPGGWLFLGAIASPLVATATIRGREIKRRVRRTRPRGGGRTGRPGSGPARWRYARATTLARGGPCPNGPRTHSRGVWYLASHRWTDAITGQRRRRV